MHKSYKLLRIEAEKQLLEDLKHYISFHENLSIDWSEACGEGPYFYKCLDGFLEEFSCVYICDSNNNKIAMGWSSFLYNKKLNVLIIYWSSLSKFNNGKLERIKEFYLPEHIFLKIPKDIRNDRKKFQRLKRDNNLNFKDLELFRIKYDGLIK